jgi:hypothetical protein
MYYLISLLGQDAPFINIFAQSLPCESPLHCVLPLLFFKKNRSTVDNITTAEARKGEAEK